MPKSSKKTFFAKVKKQYKDFMARRPHRSFRLTQRRDAVRPLELPGNIAFTHEVNKTLWVHKKTFILLALAYVILYGILAGVQSQDTYTELSQSFTEVGAELSGSGGEWGVVEQAGALFASIATSALASEMTEAQQIFSVLLFIMAWLTSVWLLRNLLAGHKVKLRDGLYNSGAPLFATFIIVLLIAVQLLPVAIAIIGYSAALSSGLLAGGVAAMLFWFAAILLGVLSLYWITSSLFALIIVTIPGMYPYQAIKSAGDMVLGRRIKILLRWLWMALIIVVTSAFVVGVMILLDMGLKALIPALQWLPLIPLTLLVLGAFVVIWGSTYVYLLYRKVVEYVPES